LLTLVQAVAPEADDNDPVKYGTRSADSVTIIGTTDEYLDTSGVGMGSIGVHPQNTLPPAIPIQDSIGTSKTSAHVHTETGKSEWD